MSSYGRRCGDCQHGEAHGLSHVAGRRGWPVTVSFWCPLKRHHDVAREACELYAEGENRRVYDDDDW